MAVKKLGRKKSHRESLIRNQLRTLFETGKLNTTTAKAKVVKGYAESVLSKMRVDNLSLSLRRELVNILGKNDLVNKVFEYSKQENSGIRIIRTGYRSGDNSQMSRLELIGKPKKKVKKVKKEEEQEDVEKDRKDEKEEIVTKNVDEVGLRKGVSNKVKDIKSKIPRAKARSGL